MRCAPDVLSARRGASRPRAGVPNTVVPQGPNAIEVCGVQGDRKVTCGGRGYCPHTGSAVPCQ